MTDRDFFKQWEQEISLKDIEDVKYPSVVGELKMVRSVSIADVVEFLELDKLYVNDVPLRIMDLKASCITHDSLILAEYGKRTGKKFKILYKDLTPGDTQIYYQLRLQFLEEKHA